MESYPQTNESVRERRHYSSMSFKQGFTSKDSGLDDSLCLRRAHTYKLPDCSGYRPPWAPREEPEIPREERPAEIANAVQAAGPVVEPTGAEERSKPVPPRSNEQQCAAKSRWSCRRPRAQRRARRPRKPRTKSKARNAPVF